MVGLAIVFVSGSDVRQTVAIGEIVCRCENPVYLSQCSRIGAGPSDGGEPSQLPQRGLVDPSVARCPLDVQVVDVDRVVR